MKLGRLRPSFFINILFATAVFATFYSAGAMDQFVQFSDKVRQDYSRACDITNSTQQAAAFSKVIESIDLNMALITQTGNKEVIKTFAQLKALSQRQQGAAVHNIALTTQHKNNSKNADIQLLRQAVDLTRKSYETYQSIKDQKECQVSLINLSAVLNPLSTTCGLLADQEKDFLKKINLFDEAVRLIQESYEIHPTLESKEAYNKTLSLCLVGAMEVYTHLNAQPVILPAENGTMDQYKAFLDSANLTHELIQLITQHLIHPKIGFTWYLEPISSPGSKAKSPQTSSSAYQSSTLDPQEFMHLPWVLYCAYQKYAATALTSLSSTCAESVKILYSQRAQEHLGKAIQMYRQHVYKGEFKEVPLKEEGFILARLEDLTGNTASLTEFYRSIRAERWEQQRQKIVRLIQAEQEERRQLEEKKKLEETEKAEKETDRKVFLKEFVVSKEANTDAIYEASSFSTSVVEAEERIEKKPKIKTRGIPHPPFSVVEEDCSSSSASQKERKQVELDPDNYLIFQRLVGQDLSRNVSLQAVRQLLGALGCEIDPTQGKGVHQKATAENGKVWIIPQAWKLPIPHYYRQDLSYFLQVDLEIDPECVIEVKNRG